MRLQTLMLQEFKLVIRSCWGFNRAEFVLQIVLPHTNFLIWAKIADNPAAKASLSGVNLLGRPTPNDNPHYTDSRKKLLCLAFVCEKGWRSPFLLYKICKLDFKVNIAFG